MATLTLDQQKAIAMANARMRRSQPQQQAPQPAQAVDEGLGGALSGRAEEIAKIAGGGYPQQTRGEDILQSAGQVAGGIGDVAGAAISAGARGLSAITPDVIEEPVVDYAKQVGMDILESDVGQMGLKALKVGMEEYGEFKKANPRAARDLESVVNIGLLATPVKVKPSGASVFGKAGKKVAETAATQSADIKKGFVKDLIMPKQTPTQKAEQVGRTVEKGILGKKEVVPTKFEQSVIEEVAKIEGVNKSNSLQSNFNAIRQEATKEALNLEASLKKNNVIFPRKEYTSRIDKAVDSLKENPLLIGDAQKSAQAIVKKMRLIAKSNPSTALGLLKSRKELDRWIKKQKGSKVFDPDKENAISIAIREVRKETNDFLNEKSVNVDVKNSLKKQSSLYSAMDNIKPKAALEADNAIGRMLQNVSSQVPLKGELVKSFAVLGGIGLGAMAVSPKMLLGATAAGGTFKAVKSLGSPQVKRALSGLLKATDKAIKTSKDDKILRQLKADRLILLSIINDGNSED